MKTTQKQFLHKITTFIWLKKKNLTKLWKMKKLKEVSFSKLNLELQLRRLIVVRK